MKSKVKLAAFTSLFVLASVAIAFAAQLPESNDATALNQAKFTLLQAVATAEQRIGGSASRAEFARSKPHGWVYNVEVVSGAQFYDVKVDPHSGTVLTTAPDPADQDDEHDERD